MLVDRCSKFSRWFIAFLLASEGSSAIAFAITAPILIGMAGLGVEVGTWYVYNRRLQNAADVASIAAAVEVAYATDGTKNQSLANSIVPVEVARNGIPTATLTAWTANVPPKTGSHVGDSGAVEVILTQKYARSLSGLFSKDVVTENVRAVATSVNGVILTGYAKDYAYDPLLVAVTPPKFLEPSATSFILARYASVDNAFAASGAPQ